MIKVIVAGFWLFLFALFSQNTLAARFWVAAGPSNWNNTTNWSALSGGAGGASVPGVADDVNFNANGLGNCTMDIAVSVKSITVAAGYTGTISQGANSVTTVNAVSFSGGTFSGGSANITVGGTFTLSGTAFTSTSAILEIKNTSVAFTSGSFSHNNGTVRLNFAGTQTITGTSPVFYVLEFVGAGSTYNLTSVGNITVLNSLNLTGTQLCTINTGTLDIKGDINSTNTNTGCGGSGLMNINGAGAQNFNGSTVSGTGALPQLTINKPSGTLTLTNFPAVANNFTYTTGTITPGTSTFCFTRGSVNAYTITGSVTLNNISFNLANVVTATIAVATVLTATGDFTIAGPGNAILNTGSINVNGNIFLTNTATGGGGTATINIIGAGAQSLDGTAIIVNQSRLPVIVVNKASGTLSLSGNISASANVTYIAGNVVAGTSTCYVVNNLTVTGNMNLNNLTIQAAGNTNLTIAAGSTVSVAGVFDMESGNKFININTGTIAVQGNIIDNNTNTTGGGTGTIIINGTAAQSITTTGIIDQGRLPSVTINKASGTMTFPSLITVVGNWTYTAGTLDVTTNNSTVVFENTMTITGTHSLNNITFDGSNNYNFTTAVGTTLTVLGNINMIGTGNITLNSGTINLLGNLVLSNTGGGGGTSVIAFTGTLAQAITSSLAINQNCLPSITINKASGTLTFPALITVRGSWVYTTGAFDVTTNNSTVVFADPLGSGVYSITGTHTLNNVTFEAGNNSTLTISTGTVLTVPGTLSFIGTANQFVNTPVVGATAIQAQGNISVANTGVGGGGTGLILINGPGAQNFSSSVASGQGKMPFITIQKTSGTLTMTGIITESRDWNYLSGTVDAITSLSTTVFGGNNLTVTSAGMSFYHAIFTANTSTLSNSMTVLGNLAINGTGILAPGANIINLAGNWTNRATAGFTEATSTVNFNGNTIQTISVPGGENFTNVTVNNSGAGIQLLNIVSVATSLNMTLGNIDPNGNSLTLGLSVLNSGTLVRTAGNIINTGSFVRWFKTATIADGSVTGLFPMGTTTNYRPLFISAPAVAPTTGGTVSVKYTDATTNSTVAIVDGLSTITVRKDLNWGVTPTGLSGGTYNLQIQGTGFGLIGNTADLRLSLVNSVVGAAGVNGGTTLNPQVNRTGLSSANLSNTFYLGSVNSSSSPLPVTLVSFTAVLDNGSVDLKWETATETQNDYFTVMRSKDGDIWESLARLSGKGNSASISYYEFFDNHPSIGKLFYKLENTDFDGHIYFSPVRLINNSSFSNGISIYPNPASDHLNIIYSGDRPFTVQIFNNAGKLMYMSEGNISSKQIDISVLSTGIYLVHIVTEGNSTTQAIVIRR